MHQTYPGKNEISITYAKFNNKPLHESLSDREFQVLQLLGAGKTTAQIGKQLALSVSTIKTYRQRIWDKLHLQSTAEVIHYALKNNLVD
jgi:DNA-binding NarL/FixJ family response regulator